MNQIPSCVPNDSAVRIPCILPPQAKTLKQSFKATLGKKQMSNECAKLIQCRKASAKNMNIKLYFSSSDQICDIGMSSWDKAAQMKEKR